MKLPIWNLVFLLIVTAKSFLADDVSHDGIVVLTDNNFEAALRDHKYILVEFYAPWCGACKEFAPEYSKAAKKWKKSKEFSKVTFAKVDATAEKRIAKEYEIASYPTLWFFKSGKKMQFKNVATADEVIKVLKKKLSYQAKILKTVKEAQRFKDSSDVAIIGFFKNNQSENAQDFIDAATAIDDFPFAITSVDEVFKKLEVKKDGVVLFKKFDDGRSVYQDLPSFIKAESSPLVVEFSQETAGAIFDSDIKLFCILVMDKKNNQHLKLLNGFRNAAIFFKNKVRLVYVDIATEHVSSLLELFNLQQSDVPVLRMLKMAEKGITKYQPESKKITEMSIRAFVNDVLDGDIKPYYKSQELPKDWDKEPVKILVKSNFKRIAMDPSKDVLVEFYAPWCGHCKQLAPIYDELGEKYKDYKDVVIAKVDGTANEFEDFALPGYPTIKLYKSGNNQVIDFKGQNTLNDLSKFVDSKGEELGEVSKDESKQDDDDDDDDDDEEDNVHEKDEL